MLNVFCSVATGAKSCEYFEARLHKNLSKFKLNRFLKNLLFLLLAILLAAVSVGMSWDPPFSFISKHVFKFLLFAENKV